MSHAKEIRSASVDGVTVKEYKKDTGDSFFRLFIGNKSRIFDNPVSVKLLTQLSSTKDGLMRVTNLLKRNVTI